MRPVAVLLTIVEAADAWLERWYWFPPHGTYIRDLGEFAARAG